jgi:hypothetical protein
MLVNEISPIALSNFGDFAYVHDEHVHVFTPHIYHIYYDAFLNANGDVQKKWTIMMDDVFIYHAHTFFALPIVCVGTRMPMSTSIEHELTKRALESIIQVSTRSNPALIPFPCFALNMPNNFSFLWFFCKHDDVILTVGVASNKLTNSSFIWFVGTHGCANFYLVNFLDDMLCVAPNMRTNFSFQWFVCTHVDDILDTLPYVLLPNSPLVASRMLNNFSFRCLESNNENEFLHEMDTMVVSQFGVFVFPHLEDVHMEFLHIDLAHALFLINLCCANGVVNMNGHVVDDMLLYHAHIYFAWSLLCEGTSDLWMSVNEWVQPHTSTTQDLSMRAHRHYAKVTSLYLGHIATL